MAITIHPTTLPGGPLGVSYEQAVAATGGTPPYSYAVTVGAIPTGLSLSSDGIISGIPTVAGAFSFTVRATDAVPATGSQAYSATIVNPFTVIVENGNVVPNANSYMSLAELVTVAQKMGQGYYNGLNKLLTLTTSEQSYILIQATAYLDRRFRFYGQIIDTDQSLEWPRTKNYDSRGHIIEPGTIPTQLKQALALLTLTLAQEPELQIPEIDYQTGDVKSFSADGLSVGYETRKTSGTESRDTATDSIFESRIPDVEVLLRSIGELLPIDYLGPDRATFVAQDQS